MPDVTMPKLSDTMDEGKILRWRKQPGDAVAVGDLLVEVETDKADMEVEASAAGVLREVRLKEGESAPVGAVIAVIDADGNSGVARPATKQPESADSRRSEAQSEEGDGARRRASAEPPRPAASRAAARPGPFQPQWMGCEKSVSHSAAGTASALRIRFLRLVFRIASSSVVPPTAMSADMRKIGVRSEIR